TMQIVRGFAYIVSGGKSVGVNNAAFYTLGISNPLGVPMPVWITLACFIVFGVLLNRATFGRNTLAVGGNAEAARLAGINVARLKVIIFALQGLIAGFAGVILASRFTSGQPKTAEGLELQVIRPWGLGGGSLTGGSGRITGVIIGVLSMGTVANAINMLNLHFSYQYVTSGSILLAAV